MIQHDNVVAEVPDHRQVVADEGHGQAHVLGQIPQEHQHMRLARHIEARDDLIRQDKAGADRDGARDADTLTLTARQLVGIAVAETGGQAHAFQCLDRLISSATKAVSLHRLRDDAPDLVPRVERRHRVLKNHLQIPAHRAQRLFGHTGNVVALKQNRTAVGIQKPDQHPAKRGFPRTGFTDNSGDPPFADVEIQALQHLDPRRRPEQRFMRAVGKGQAQVADGKERLGGHMASVR